MFSSAMCAYAMHGFYTSSKQIFIIPLHSPAGSHAKAVVLNIAGRARRQPVGHEEVDVAQRAEDASVGGDEVLVALAELLRGLPACGLGFVCIKCPRLIFGHGS
jgi:hypothetical protein